MAFVSGAAAAAAAAAATAALEEVDRRRQIFAVWGIRLLARLGWPGLLDVRTTLRRLARVAESPDLLLKDSAFVALSAIVHDAPSCARRGAVLLHLSRHQHAHTHYAAAMPSASASASAADSAPPSSHNSGTSGTSGTSGSNSNSSSGSSSGQGGRGTRDQRRQLRAAQQVEARLARLELFLDSLEQLVPAGAVRLVLDTGIRKERSMGRTHHSSIVCNALELIEGRAALARRCLRMRRRLDSLSSLDRLSSSSSSSSSGATTATGAGRGGQGGGNASTGDAATAEQRRPQQQQQQQQQQNQQREQSTDDEGKRATGDPASRHTHPAAAAASSSVSLASAVAASAWGFAKHVGVTCSRCGVSPIRGPRFRLLTPSAPLLGPAGATSLA